ncbi:hypothetical protein AIT68_005165 [Salmonella enterica subsp. salamae]|uniref:hypothetical protein n=1 Tax=Salmonella enterica TaxID=28901 RepID=UPI0012B70F72|nr:hypothetical protein [Salmonella enterica]EBQ5245858.1 hypothetical protein [Salmonella enterica subsp. salamae]
MKNLLLLITLLAGLASATDSVAADVSGGTGKINVGTVVSVIPCTVGAPDNPNQTFNLNSVYDDRVQNPVFVVIPNRITLSGCQGSTIELSANFSNTSGPYGKLNTTTSGTFYFYLKLAATATSSVSSVNNVFDIPEPLPSYAVKGAYFSLGDIGVIVPDSDDYQLTINTVVFSYDPPPLHAGTYTGAYVYNFSTP